MARIAGVDLPPNKHVWVALTYIYGIGESRSRNILEEAGVDRHIPVNELTEEQVRSIRQVVQEEGNVEGELRKQTAQDIKRLMEIGSYRGQRHRKGLPVRGQRTQTNARTRKGPRKTATSGRRKATKK